MTKKIRSKNIFIDTIDFTKAPCAGLQSIFFDKYSVRQAKIICLNCEFKSECKRLAVKREECFGVWGGVNFENRTERNRALKEFREV